MRSIWRRTPLQAFVVGLVAAGLHAGAVANGFVFDDHQIIEANPLVTQPGRLAEILTSHYWHPLRARGYLYRPLTVLSLRLDHLLGGGRPALFHATNVVLHAAACALALILLARLYGETEGVPLAGALLFACHPVHTEAVAAIAGRADLLAALFALAAWWLHLRGRVLLAVLLFMAGMLSKESAIVLPGILGLSDLMSGEAPADRRRLPGWAARRLAPSAGALVLYLALRAALLGSPGGGDPALISPIDNPTVSASAPVRIATAVKVITIQARLLLFPWRLSADYSFDQIPLVRSPADPSFLAGAGLLAAGLGAAWVFRRRREGPTFPILFHLICIAPVSNVALPIGTILAERTLYLPSLGACAGVALALAAAACRLAPRPAAARLLTASGLAIAALFGARTVARVGDWRDDVALFESAARGSPRSAKAHYNLGMVRLRSGDAAAALPALERAVEIARGLPDRPDMMRDLAAALTRLGRRDEALAVLERARLLDPRHVGVLVNLGNAYAERGDLARALEAYEAALRIQPSHPGARMNRARLLARGGRLEEAIRELEQVTREAPRLLEALYNLADAYAAAGREKEAARALRDLLRLAGPEHAELSRAARERLARIAP